MLGNHIRHLLFRDPTHKNDERDLRIHLKTEFRLQRHLAYRLAGDILHVEIGGEISVRRGIPNPVICTVEDANEIFRATLQQPFESTAIFGSENFPCICRADGCQTITVADAGFEE